MVEVSLTVGKLDASLALLLTKDHHLIEFPTILLPNGVRAGSIVKIKCDQDLETEKEEAQHFQNIQDEILNAFGTNLPQSPVLKIKNITQTSCVLEWDSLELGTASLKNLILFKDGKKLGAIPQPLTNTTTKLSGLPIDKTFQFQLRLDTTAGVYLSEVIEVTTHKMTDLSGITVCLGDFSPNDPFTVDDIVEALKNMGAHLPPHQQIKVDTTHYICSKENKNNPEFIKASEMNIPIVRPEWLKACESERRIVGVRDFYIKDCVLPDIIAKNYWGKAQGAAPVVPHEETPKTEAEAPVAPLEESLEPTEKEPAPEAQVEEPIKTPEASPSDSVEANKEETSEIEEIPLPESAVKHKVTDDQGEPEVAELDEVDLSEPPAEESIEEPKEESVPSELSEPTAEVVETIAEPSGDSSELEINTEQPVETPSESAEKLSEQIEEKLVDESSKSAEEPSEAVEGTSKEAEESSEQITSSEPIIEPGVQSESAANTDEIDAEEEETENENEGEANEEVKGTEAATPSLLKKKKKNKKKGKK